MVNSKNSNPKIDPKNQTGLIVYSKLLPAHKTSERGREEGRPNAITPEILERLKQAFLLGCDDTEASAFAGIAPATLYNHQKGNKEFLEWKTALKQNPFLLARQTIVKHLDRDPEFALKYMERKKAKEFGPKAHLFVGVDDTDTMDIEEKDVISNAIAEHFKHGLKRAKQAQQAEVIDMDPIQ